jgi:hypothetical protein
LICAILTLQRGTPDGGADVASAHRALASFLQLCLMLRLSRLSCETSAPTKRSRLTRLSRRPNPNRPLQTERCFGTALTCFGAALRTHVPPLRARVDLLSARTGSGQPIIAPRGALRDWRRPSVRLALVIQPRVTCFPRACTELGIGAEEDDEERREQLASIILAIAQGEADPSI